MRKARMAILLWGWMVLGLGAETGADFSVDAAIARRGKPDFKQRVAAQSELRDWGKEHLKEGIASFYGAYRTNDDPEVRARCRDLLKELVIVSQSGEGKGYIGIMMMEDRILLAGEVRGVVRVTAVLEGTPAEKAKMKVGDLVTGIDELDLKEDGATLRFGAYAQTKSPQMKVTLHLLRGGKKMDLEMELMRRPPINEQNFLRWGEQLRPPSQKDVEEEEFKEWLKKRLVEENEKNKGL